MVHHRSVQISLPLLALLHRRRGGGGGGGGWCWLAVLAGGLRVAAALEPETGNVGQVALALGNGGALLALVAGVEQVFAQADNVRVGRKLVERRVAQSVCRERKD